MRVLKQINNMTILYWLIFILLTIYQFNKLNFLIDYLHEHSPETLGYEIRLETALLVMVIAFYLMLSTLIILVKDKKIKGCYYALAIILIIISGSLIEKYYYHNSFFTKLEEYNANDMVFSIHWGIVWNPHGIFFNPSLLPFLFSIVTLILPFISEYLKALKEE